ncbi:ABC transporter ATP-binding protein [Scopulibacillus cellulosilyticus]|uniref:ABC transporter ATP-binding protein n=1 Tax=Scopulibacillus cellulosilyticus TaxID=2665665 RepID=A0ABW2PVV4_9BACL
MGSKYALQLQNLTKKIGRTTIIDDITLNIPKGEVFGLLGPNGSGKTTMIRMMAGLMKITKGEIFIHGINIKKDFEGAIKHVGAIVENPELYKFLTGYQNLQHYARMVPGISEERIKEAASLVKLDQRIYDKVDTYSLGMRQRLGVAQALLHRPSVLILDEPTNGLDPAGIRELRDYLRHLTDTEGTTVVVSSHMLLEMELLCDRLAIIRNGRLLDEGHIKDLIHSDDQVPVRFNVDDKSRIHDILSQVNSKAKYKQIMDGFEITLSKEEIAVVNAALVANGIKVYGINPVTKTLEDSFLQITGDGEDE